MAVNLLESRRRALTFSMPENLYKDGDKTFTAIGMYELSKPLPPGNYKIYVDVASTDTERQNSFFRFMRSDETEVASTMLPRKYNVFKVTLTDTVTHLYMYASENYSRSVGDTATFSKIKIIKVK